MMEWLNRTANPERASKIKTWHFFGFVLFILLSGIVLGINFARLMK